MTRVFEAEVNVFAEPIRFEAYTEPTGTSAGMGNEMWAEVDNPLYDPDNPFLHNGEPLGPKDFPGFIPDIMQPLSQTLARGGSNEATQAGSLYGPRDYAIIVEPDWRFKHGNVYYRVIGDPNFNIIHPLTRQDYGYVQWTIRKGG